MSKKKIPWHKVRPIGGLVKVRLSPPEKLSETIVLADTYLNKEKLTRQHGIIVWLGEGAFGPDSPRPDPNIKVGDMAVFEKYAGHSFENPDDENEVYRVMPDDNIWGTLSAEELKEYGYTEDFDFNSGKVEGAQIASFKVNKSK